jgi:hypothetical protein
MLRGWLEEKEDSTAKFCGSFVTPLHHLAGEARRPSEPYRLESIEQVAHEIVEGCLEEARQPWIRVVMSGRQQCNAHVGQAFREKRREHG